MLGYEDNDFTFKPYKTQDEHFALFCLVLECGFALHLGKTGRLITDYLLQDAGFDRSFPKVELTGPVTFQVPEELLKPSQLYLYYEPDADADIPKLATYRPEQSDFKPFTLGSRDDLVGQSVFPVVKMGSLQGLHYLKDIACLQLFELDLKGLQELDAELASHLYEILTSKLEGFSSFSQPWLTAARNEDLAKAYLEGGSVGVSSLLDAEAEQVQAFKPQHD